MPHSFILFQLLTTTICYLLSKFSVKNARYYAEMPSKHLVEEIAVNPDQAVHVHANLCLYCFPMIYPVIITQITYQMYTGP